MNDPSIISQKNKSTAPDKDLSDLAKLFLKLGFIGFGGPAAHIAMMQEEVVVRRKWMTEQHFIDLIGATNLIPGPNSTELAIHIGREKGGWKGLIVAGLCFILPAVLITGTFAYLYVRYGTLPAVHPFIYGIKPAIIAVIIAAVFPLAGRSLKTLRLWIFGVIGLTLHLSGLREVYIIFGAGLIAILFHLLDGKFGKNRYSFFPLFLLQIPGSTWLSISHLKLFLVFLKIGAILYGSGYVLFAYVESELVAKGIITHQQLTDAIAVGQFTPGPVFSSVTFIGYLVNGYMGAVVSTIAVFLPSFLFVALLNPLVRRMRKWPAFSAFLDAVNVASIAVILGVCFELGKTTFTDWRSILIGIVSLLLIITIKKINTAFIVLGGALAGYLLTHV
ncbi:chromate efflux transporter [Flavitalea antarctica]